MPTIDLTQYVVARQGAWFERADAFTPDQIILADPGDFVTFTGPLGISVTLQAENATVGPGGAEERPFHHDVYSYSLMVPAGHTWSFSSPSDDGRHLAQALLGGNRGVRIVIRPGFVRMPTAAVSLGDGLPCDFAVGTHRALGEFFPSPCESCPPGLPVGLPPTTPPTLVAPAAGGCVRPRFFNGMFITREDLETSQRFFRMKNKLQNRAMGAGVVWGLSVVRHREGICVMNGYAVDCCGNDLVLTEPYHVGVEALLRDPAAMKFMVSPQAHRSWIHDDCDDLSRPRPFTPIDPDNRLCRRMHLLLEYIECPEEPRPVHGDACSPQATRCEMSRIRETVRLRLVPPRDYDAKGPIDRFLKEVEGILKENGVEPAPGAAPTEAPVPTDAAVPFQVAVGSAEWNVTGSTGLGPLAVSAQPDRVREVASDLPGGQPNLGANVVIEFRIRMAPGFALTLESDIVGETTRATVNPGSRDAVVWSVVSQPALPPPLTRAWEFRLVWVATPTSGSATQTLSGTTWISFQTTHVRGVDVTDIITGSYRIPPTEILVRRAELGPLPCLLEACSCGENPRFPVFPPFLHEDPRRRGESVDWKVLLSSVVYGWLSQEFARHRVGTPSQVITQRLQILQMLYTRMIHGFFGVRRPEDLERMTKALRCLFDAWCKNLLYPGPHCDGEPHGVVIGCASIKGGRIVDVDPWGGRRWVVHYPLLSHWGHQFGVAPPDLTASRLFSMICCIGHLPAPVTSPRVPQQVDEPSPEARVTPLMRFDSLVLMSGTREEAMAQLRSSGVRVAATRELSFPEFAGEFLLRLREPPMVPDAPYTVFHLKDAPDVHFAAPVPAEVLAAGTDMADPGTSASGRLGSKVRDSSIETRRKLTPLLRNVGDALAANVLKAVSLVPPAVDAGRDLIARLHTVSIRTYGVLLGETPEFTLARAGFEHAKTLNRLLAESEAMVEAVTASAHEALHAQATDSRVESSRDLLQPEIVNRLAQRLVEVLATKKVNLSIEAARQAVEASLPKS